MKKKLKKIKIEKSDMNRKMKKLSISLCIACLTGIMAAGCTEETDSDKRLPDGKYPMTFTAAVDGLTVTRAGTADRTGK